MDLAAATARSLWSLVSVPSALGAHSPDHESFSDDAGAISNGSNGDGRGSPSPDSPDASRYSAYYWNDRAAPSAPVLDSATTTRITTSLMGVDEESDEGQAAEIGISDIVTWFFPSLAPDAPSSAHDSNRSSSPPGTDDPNATPPPRSSTPSASSSPARQAALEALTRNFVARRPAGASAVVATKSSGGGANPLSTLASILLGASALRAMGNSSVWSALVKRLKNKYWLVALAVAMAALPFMGLVSYVISLHVQNLYDRHLRTEWHRLYSSITASTLDSGEYADDDEDNDVARRHANPNDDEVDLVEPTRISRRTTRLRQHPPSSARYSDGSHQRRPADFRRSDPLPQRHDPNHRSGHRPLSSTFSTTSGAGLDQRTRGRSSTYSQYTDEPPRLSSPPLYSPLADQYDSSNDDPDYPLSPTTSASVTPPHPPTATSAIQPDDILQLTYELDHLRTLLAHEAAQEQMLRGEIATMREVLGGVLAQMRGLQEVQGRLLDAATFSSVHGSRSPSRYRRRGLSLSPVLAPEGEGRALSVSPIRRVPSALRLDLLSLPPTAADSGHALSPPSLVISAATPPQTSPRSISPPSASEQAPQASTGPSAADTLATTLVARRRAVRSSLSKISDTQLKSYLVEAVLRGNCSNVRDVLEHVNERLESELSEESEEEEECTESVRASGGQLETEKGNQAGDSHSTTPSPAAAVAVGYEPNIMPPPASPPTPPMSPSPRVFLVDEPELQLPLSDASPLQAEDAPVPSSSSLLSTVVIPAPSPPSPMPGSMPLSPPMVKEPLLPTPPASSSSSATSSPAHTPRTPTSAQLVHPPTQQPSSSSSSSTSSSASKRTRPAAKPFTLNPPARYRVVATPGRIPPPPTSMFSPSVPDQVRPRPPAGRVSWHATSSSKPSSSAATVIGAPSPSTAPSLATAARAAARRKARSDIGPRST